MTQPHEGLITNPAVTMGLLAIILGLIFKTAHSQNHFWRKFYKYVPALLLCYFIPSLLNTFGIVDGKSADAVYHVASRYLLPACLILLTISIDLKAILNLGPKALIMFLTGTLGIVIGGPLAILVASAINPDIVGGHGPDAVWRGMTTIAGSWIGGGANQASMKEMFEVGGDIFSAMVTVDVIVANLWMAVLLLMAGNHKAIDARTGADTSAIEDLKKRVEAYHAEHARMPTLNDYMTIIAIAFGITGLAHFCGDILAPYFNQFAWAQEYSLNSKFFWLIVISTTIGISLSFTRVRHIEAFGASKVASSFLYILVASIGLHMNITAILDTPWYFFIGVVWMLTHAALMLIVAKFIKAPLFYMAVGSQANVGGAASAPVVASAFHPSLAPVGVLLAVLGYGVGTYMAYICGLIMQSVAF
ncbi:DUF819 family protein [Pseudoalteromonas pernae]|uniref:DUF819 family protein n=1 Tax=Pseudoalteromonas pernae TaxID=3118054 RepID=UPI003242B0C7